MGYYYTTSPENAVLGKSRGMPETHTPASPVKERGHRYYMSEIGEWSSRDPLGEEFVKTAFMAGKDKAGRRSVEEASRKPSYVMVGNDPIRNIDPIGLSIFGPGYLPDLKLDCKDCQPMSDGFALAWKVMTKCDACRKALSCNVVPLNKTVTCPKCMVGYGLTNPFTGTVYLNQGSCNDLDKAGWASIIFHELAHDCCPPGVFGEACANKAQDICDECLKNVNW